jgi:hypothetical protein
MNEPTREQLTALRDECYKIACDHGFHDEERSEQHFLCLVITELSEAVQADRKDMHADIKTFNAALDGFECEVAFEAYIKDTVEDELADAAIRILDLAGMNGDTFSGFSSEPYKRDGGMCDYFKRKTFTESIYEICDDIFTIGYDVALYDLFTLAEVMGFDLMEHIRFKMEYNKTRERLHDRKY